MARTGHVHASCNAVTLVRGSLKLAPINSQGKDKYLLGERSALWGEPERVAGALVFYRICLGKRLGHQMYIMPVFVEECS